MRKKLSINKQKRVKKLMEKDYFAGDEVFIERYGKGVIKEIDEYGVCAVRLENGELRNFTKEQIEK